jgi:Uma2 family endonuclease
VSRPVRLGHPATYEDLLKIPDHQVAEIVDDQLYVSPRLGSTHALAHSRLGAILVPPFSEGLGGPGGWWIIDDPEIHLRRDVVVPDLAGWRHDRMPEYPDVKFLELSPDWVCEVLSPASERFDRSMKLNVYEREHVNHLWLLNPLVPALEVFRRGANGLVVSMIYGAGELVRAEPFEAIEFAMTRLVGAAGSMR